jgi:hypothetical protein
MTIWNPDWLLEVDGTEYTSVTINNLIVTSGRTDINSQPRAGYCQFEILNYSNEAIEYNVGSTVTVSVKDSSGTFVELFGGNITDLVETVKAAGSVEYFTSTQIIALGSLAKLPKAITTGILSQDQDGDQIYSLLAPFLTLSWDELPTTQTWTSTSATATWANYGNLGLGEIDQPGQFTMENRSSSETNLYTLISDIASSALGYIYEDSQGNIGYADAAHRQNYLANYGYVELSANDALWQGVRTVTRSGDIRNKVAINYGNNYGSQKTSTDQVSIDTYGLLAETINSLIHDPTDAQTIADRYVDLRAYPNAKFDSITFPIGSPELSDADRDSLLGVFMGMPVRITNLPQNISAGQFEGFIEGWTFRSTINGLSLTFNASPVAYSLVTVKWDGVSASEAWNTLSSTLTWETAIGAVA